MDVQSYRGQPTTYTWGMLNNAIPSIYIDRAPLSFVYPISGVWKSQHILTAIALEGLYFVWVFGRMILVCWVFLFGSLKQVVMNRIEAISITLHYYLHLMVWERRKSNDHVKYLDKKFRKINPNKYSWFHSTCKYKNQPVRW